jgi:hypothetical protein
VKNLFVKTLIFIAAVTLTFNAKAQTDYVITVKGDSIPCKITTPLVGRPKYKVDSASDSKKIKPDEIREYYIARKDFRERSVYTDSNSKPIFVTIIEKGRISLYELVTSHYNNGFTTTTTEWYAGKGSDYVTDLKTSSLFLFKSKKKRKDIFGEMLSDNKAVYDKYVGEDKFSFKQIRNLVHLYNTGQLLKD